MTDFLPNEGIDNNHSKTIVMGNKEKRISFGFLMNLGTPLTAKLKADGGETWVVSSHLHQICKPMEGRHVFQPPLIAQLQLVGAENLNRKVKTNFGYRIQRYSHLNDKSFVVISES